MDAFSVFGEQPRPWLDPEQLKQKFFTLSAEHHPDKFQEASAKAQAESQFASLNQSYNLLRHGRSRLLHFLEAQGWPSPAHVQDVPAAALDFFDSVAAETRKADNLIKLRSEASSPMLKVQLFEQSLMVTTRLQNLQNGLHARVQEIEKEIQAVDARWAASGDRSVFPALQLAASALGFLERWQAQVQQRLAALAF